ncbi:phosphoenolpyruvate synthase [Patescibacteria group bacterium]|nr:phosphoenolpyruvate synthase [Patescibacteria group bacterium]
MQTILWFRELTLKNVPQVGGKNASLGEMYQKLGKQGVRIPNGFATTAEAYWRFMQQDALGEKIEKILEGLDVQDVKELALRGEKVRKLILKTPLSQELADELKKAYQRLSQEYKTKAVDVAVRSSATAEDLPDASFAGQMETYLNVQGPENLLKAAHKCLASLFTNRAIVYRQSKGFKHSEVALSIGVQKMVRSDLACSGVMFSCDTESGFADVTVINSSWGLGENVVQGKVSPDEFMVFEPLLDQGYRPIVNKRLGGKEWRMTYGEKGKTAVKNIKTTPQERSKFTLSDQEVLELARYSVLIEKHYGRPMDMEWGKDGKDKKLYILQARPETVQSLKSVDVLERFVFKPQKEEKKVLITGVAVGSKIGQGEVNVIKSAKDIVKFKPGQVLVTKMTDPDWVPIMKIASAIITDDGGRVCHAAIVSREMGVPCVVGTGDATQKIKSGQKVTVSCAEGEVGRVYQGLLPFQVKKTRLKNFKKPETKVMLNLAEPSQAFGLSFLPNDGVGLAREEFIINNHIKIHPLALINFKKIKDQKIKKKINEITAGYQNKVDFYIHKLAEGIGTIAAAFYPKDVIVRFSDFKSNEYANLVGGSIYEPEEANPMIGWRGASRYNDPKFKKAFQLECEAIKKVREEFGLDNVIVMVPFCRTIGEARSVLKIIEESGLRKKYQKQKPLQIYVMAEIPSNIVLAKEFAQLFDGFSIGSNDLTQLTLGLDRDSSLVAHLFDERNEAVKKLIQELIKVAHQNNCKVGICGQGPSDFPDFAEFLVKEGIDSISLLPDTIIETTMRIANLKKK